MTATALLGGALAGASVLALGASWSTRARSRLLALAVRPAPVARAGDGMRLPYAVALLVCLLGALTFGVDGVDPIALFGLAAAIASVLWLSRQRGAAATRRQAEAVAAELPSAADLLATCLSSGAPPVDALQTVAEATLGPLADRLRRVAGSLRLGAKAADAWGPISRSDPLAPLARALVRSDTTGAPIADTLIAVADDQRRVARWTAEAAARRAGVLAVGPLAVCFLPAFVLIGVVPVIVAVAGDVLDGLR
ncbi:MAG: type II secretion system F family protein [Sporichthyaceae bacterium]